MMSCAKEVSVAKVGITAPARECFAPTPSVPLHPERGKREYDDFCVLSGGGGGLGG